MIDLLMVDAREQEILARHRTLSQRREWAVSQKIDRLESALRVAQTRLHLVPAEPASQARVA